MGEMITFRQALAEAQTDAMTADERVFVFGLDVADHKSILGSTKGLVEKFGKNKTSDNLLVGFEKLLLKIKIPYFIVQIILYFLVIGFITGIIVSLLYALSYLGFLK